MKIYNLKEYEKYFDFKIVEKNKEIGVYLHKEPTKYITILATQNNFLLIKEDIKTEIPLWELAFNNDFIEALKEVNEDDFKYNRKEDVELFKKFKEDILSII